MIKTLDVFSLLWAALVGIPVLPFFEFMRFILPFKITTQSVIEIKQWGSCFSVFGGVFCLFGVCVYVCVFRKKRKGKIYSGMSRDESC